MSDIRKFFTSSKPVQSPKKTALTAERLETGTPKKVEKVNKAKKRDSSAIVLDDDESDFECPVPATLKPEIKKNQKKAQNERRVTLDSSEEEFFDESIGTKLSKKKAPKSTGSNKKTKNIQIDSDSDVEIDTCSRKRKARVIDTPSPVKKTPLKKSKVLILESSDDEDVQSKKKKLTKKLNVISDDSEEEAVKPKKRKQSKKTVVESSDDEPKAKKAAKKSKRKESSPEIMEVDEADDFEPERNNRSKRSRRRTPPNQHKLDAMLNKKVPAAKSLPKVVPPKKELPKVDPLDFFSENIVPKAAKPVARPRSPDIVEMPDSDEELDVKKPKITPKKSITPKKAEAGRKSKTPKKSTPLKTLKTPSKATPKKSGKAKKDTPKKEVKKPEAAQPIKPKMQHPDPPKALPALPRPQRAELPWVDKYKPITLKDLIGQGTPQSPTNKLLKWLQEWAKNNLGVGGLVKKPKPGIFDAQKDGTAFKAALVSGPPGIGKTTSAVLCCKQLGLKYVEMNASDARNKKLLDDKIAQLLDNRQVNEYFTGEKPNNEKNQITHVLIMDEVDGMSGNQDRAGIAELIAMIKTTKVPIICICNDRQSQKIRSLANHCFDLRFQRPRVEQIRARLMTVKVREKIDISPQLLDQMIEASNHDVRQSVYSLQLYAAGAKGQVEKKDISVNIFEAARKILSKESSIAEKQELYFSDYSILPLFVQENFPHVRGEGANNLSHLKAIRRAATCIAEADLIDKQVRSNGAWSLLPQHGIMSCALPATHLDGHMTNQIAFPSWLGKYSSGNKRLRMMRQLASHAHLKITGSGNSIVTDYLPVLRDSIYRPLAKHDSDGVKEVVEIFNYYNLTRDDTEAINELGLWPGSRDLLQNVSTKAKSALTRNLNKESHKLPYSVGTVVKGRKKVDTATDVEIDEEGHVIEKKLGGNSDDEAAIDDDKDEKEENPEIKINVKITTNGTKPTASKRGGATTTGTTRGGRGRGKATRGK